VDKKLRIVLCCMGTYGCFEIHYSERLRGPGQLAGGLAEAGAHPNCHHDLSLQRDVMSVLPGNHHVEMGACFLHYRTEL